eukprot:534950-Prorocentrum_minimum.AAC.2
MRRCSPSGLVRAQRVAVNAHVQCAAAGGHQQDTTDYATLFTGRAGPRAACRCRCACPTCSCRLSPTGYY